MRGALSAKSANGFDLKLGVGGIADIEFIVQFGILAETAKHPCLAEHTGIVNLLAGLQQQGFINATDAALLKQAYCSFRDYSHHQVLQGESAIAADGEFVELRAEVARIWGTVMKE